MRTILEIYLYNTLYMTRIQFMRYKKYTLYKEKNYKKLIRKKKN